MQKPALESMDVYAALVDYQQDRPWERKGTGDVSHGWGMYRLPLYHLRNVLQHLRLNRATNSKVGVKCVSKPVEKLLAMVTGNYPKRLLLKRLETRQF
jgi:hypothetical protein